MKSTEQTIIELLDIARVKRDNAIFENGDPGQPLYDAYLTGKQGAYNDICLVLSDALAKEKYYKPAQITEQITAPRPRPAQITEQITAQITEPRPANRKHTPEEINRAVAAALAPEPVKLNKDGNRKGIVTYPERIAAKVAQMNRGKLEKAAAAAAPPPGMLLSKKTGKYYNPKPSRKGIKYNKTGKYAKQPAGPPAPVPPSIERHFGNPPQPGEFSNPQFLQ